MGLSATASFSAAAFLFGIGALTSAQELTRLNAVMTHAYSFFSHVLWPVYIPVAVLLMEPNGWRRRALTAFVAAGAAVGACLLCGLVVFPGVSKATGQRLPLCCESNGLVPSPTASATRRDCIPWCMFT